MLSLWNDIQTKIGFQLFFNVLGIFAINLVLFLAFYFQLFDADLPCPLCLLQRSGFILVGLALLMNIRYGISMFHYGLAFIGSLLTLLMALRQIFLHILPHDKGYGSLFLGWHTYTWSFVLSILSIALISLTMMLPIQKNLKFLPKWMLNLIGIISTLFLFLIFTNFISTIMLCKLGPCADNPNHYELLQNL